MQNLLPSEILGQTGVFEFLKEIEKLQAIETDSVFELMERSGIEHPDNIYEQLNQISIIFESDRKLYLSSKGHEMWWLLQAVNGSDLNETIHRLRQLNPELFPYEIVFQISIEAIL